MRGAELACSITHWPNCSITHWPNCSITHWPNCSIKPVCYIKLLPNSLFLPDTFWYNWRWGSNEAEAIPKGDVETHAWDSFCSSYMCCCHRRNDNKLRRYRCSSLLVSELPTSYIEVGTRTGTMQNWYHAELVPCRTGTMQNWYHAVEECH